MAESPLPADASPPEEVDLLPRSVTTLYSGDDGHLYLAEGDGRRTTRLSWSDEDFAVVPGFPALGGVTGDLEDSHIFAHPTPSRSGDRVAVFGLLPTLEEELAALGHRPWEDAEASFHYLVVGQDEDDEGDADDGDGDTLEDDVAGPGVVLPMMAEGAEDEDIVELSEEDEDEELPPFWPGGKVYVIHTDGVQVWEPFEFESGSPTHLDWAPDDRHLLVLHQDDGTLHLDIVDAVDPGEPWRMASGAPIFWSWQPRGQRLALRVMEPGQSVAQLQLADPLLRSGPRTVADAGSFYVPAWRPDGGSFAYAEPGGREDRIVLADAEGHRQRSLFGFPGRGAMRWNPAGNKLAVSIAPEGHGAFQVLEVVNLNGKGSKTLWQAPFIAFEWLPDGKSLLLCTADEEQGRLGWLRVGLDGSSTVLGPPFIPSREAVVALHFFEQVGLSHPFISRDGQYVVCSGYPLEECLLGGPGEGPDYDDDDDTDLPPRILVTPLDGSTTVAVGTGRFACFGAPARR